MKAIVFNQHGASHVLQYAEVAAPRPAAGEALVAVGAVAVNHGPDVETRRRGFMMGDLPLPHIGGTDPAGEIVELGPGVSDFSVGERVAIYPVIACGECDFCLAGAGENYCRNSRLFGVQTPGGRAEYVAVPATQLVRLPDEEARAHRGNITTRCDGPKVVFSGGSGFMHSFDGKSAEWNEGELLSARGERRDEKHNECK